MSTRAAMASPQDRAARLRKSQQFALAAGVIEDYADGDRDLDDAYVTLCVHAGIAASDVICMKRLDKYSRGEDHREAVAMLHNVDGALAKHLDTLLSMKTKAGYSTVSVASVDVTRAGRAMRALVEAAER